MAWKFADQIHSLSGFDAESTDDSDVGEDFNLLANQWLVDAAKEVINALPLKFQLRCATRSTLNNSATTFDLDGKGSILHVVRLSADSGGYQKACRQIHGAYGDLTNDSTDLINYATVTDPVYWITNNSSGNPTLFVKPLPTANQPAYVHHVAYPPNSTSWDGSNLPGAATSIANFPSEAEYLVVLRAAITAAEYKAAIEEDIEIYIPIINNLRTEYSQGIRVLRGDEKQVQKARGENK